MNLNTNESLSDKQLRELKQKDRYELEKRRIIEQIGDLEDIRATLGLSQRKMCQLLLVDPSAWTRWLKSGAPPHVYQALKWLIELRQHNPDAMLSQSLDHRIDLVQNIARDNVDQLKSQIIELENKLHLLAGTQHPAQQLDVDVYELKSKMALLLEMSSNPAPRPKKRAKKKKKKTLRKKKAVRSKKKAKKKKVRRKRRS